jgi:hypothetical protein
MLEHVPLVVQTGMFILPLVVATLFVAAAWASAARESRRRVAGRAGLGVAALLILTAMAARSGVLADSSRRPPAMLVVMLLATVAAIVTARSSLGARVAQLPLWALVGAQAFRLPLELVMHQAANAGVMPVEMSFGGLNFDIVTGASALVLGAALYSRRERSTGQHAPGRQSLVWAWNVMGSVLLTVVVSIALLTSPSVRAFGPDHVNRWVLYFPYVWLPTVLVEAALFGHIVIFRRLLTERAQLRRLDAAVATRA